MAAKQVLQYGAMLHLALLIYPQVFGFIIQMTVSVSSTQKMTSIDCTVRFGPADHKDAQPLHPEIP